MPTLSDRLLQLKKERGLLQKDIAMAVGLSVMGYQRYENGTRQPNAETLAKLADYFQVSADYLLGRTEKIESIKMKSNCLNSECLAENQERINITTK